MYRSIKLCLIVLLLSGCGISDKITVKKDEEKLIAIPLELTTHLGDQQQFVEGDEIQFLLSLGQDAYIYMYYVDAANNITQILPNENQPSNFYMAGYFLTIPEYKNLYRFTISEPFGSESVWVVASDRSMSTGSLSGSIDDIRRSIKRSSKKAFGEYVLKISTRKK